MYTDSFLLHCAPVSIHTALPWVAESYRWDAKECLGVDHVLIAHDVLVKTTFEFFGPPRRCERFRRVGKYYISDLEMLIQGVQHFHRDSGEQSFNSIQCLAQVAARSTRKVFPSSYQDSAAIKNLCRVRSVTADSMERQRLSREIFLQRKECRKQWRQDLWYRASCGDWKARQALQRPTRKSGGLQHLVSATGSVQSAVESLRHFFASRFSGRPPLDPTALPWSSSAVSTEILPGVPEIQQHVVKLQQGKTTGISGVSNDFLHSVMQVPGGADALQRALHALFSRPCSV